MTRDGGTNNWGPCPVCDASVTSRKGDKVSDKRPPVRLKGTDQWLCVSTSHTGEPKGGGPVALARALHAKGRIDDAKLAELLAGVDGSAPAVVDDAPMAPSNDGSINVPAGWSTLQRSVAVWRDPVMRWCRDRGFSPEMSRALLDCGGVAAATPPPGGWPRSWSREMREWMAAVRWSPLDLLVPLRSPAGEVVDIERRHIRKGPRPEGTPKTARLKPELRGTTIPDPVMFGRLPRAVEVAKQGGIVVLVEGSSDWLAAEAACILHNDAAGPETKPAAALGGYGAGCLPKIAKALTKAAEAADIRPGSFTVCVVPDVGDNLHKPDSYDYRVGERHMWNAAVELLDVARVRWCPPATRGKADLGDYLIGEAAGVGGHPGTDPVKRFWHLMRNGHAVLNSGCPIVGKPGEWFELESPGALRRWQEAPDYKLRRAAYRLPLHEFLNYHRWYLDKKDNTLEYNATMGHGRRHDSATRLTEAVLYWLRAHKIRFAKGPEARHVFDPLEVAQAPLVGAGQPRSLPRVFQVKSKEHWLGWLQELGRINPATATGRVIDKALQQYAQRSAHTELRPWLTSAGEHLTAPTVSLHLSDRTEEVLQVDAAGARLVANGAGEHVLQRDPKVPPIEWVEGIEPAAASALLWRLIGSALTVDHPMRSLMLSHSLMAPIRQHILTRPILYSTGPAGVGKSQYAKHWSAIQAGNPRPKDPTLATAYEAARSVPVLVLDNMEPRFVDTVWEKFLLTAATGVEREKRSVLSDRGMVSQPVNSLVFVSAIGPPTSPEMLRRCLIVNHGPEHRTPGFSEVENLEAVVGARSAIWSGIMRLYQSNVLPALADGAHRRWAQTIPAEHPVEGMREALGIMGTIAETLSSLEPVWGHMSRLWPLWLDYSRAAITDTRLHTDPLTLAMGELLRQWNRTVEAFGGRRRPALADALFACRPLFWNMNLKPSPKHMARHNGDPAMAFRGWFTPDVHQGMTLDGVPQVVGFTGEYPHLFRDLCTIRPAFRDDVRSAKAVSRLLAKVGGWASLCVKRPNTGLRQYRWTALNHLERLVEDGESVEQPPSPEWHGPEAGAVQ